MGSEAIRIAMEQARISWSDVDLLIDCSTSRYRPIPCNAAHYLNIAGTSARGIPCFDIQSTCLGFLVALNAVNGLFAAGGYRNIVLVASECAMKGVNWKQPESAGLIGDGAAAAVLSSTPPFGPLLMVHETYAEHLDLCKVNGGAHYMTAMEYSDDRMADYLFDMNGPAVFRVALGRLPRMVRSLVTEWQSLPENQHRDISDLHIIPHQASPRALDVVRGLLNSDESHFHSQVRDVGNMAAASLPFMLDWCLRTHRIPATEPFMLLGTSAGYAQAAMILSRGPDCIEQATGSEESQPC